MLCPLYTSVTDYISWNFYLENIFRRQLEHVRWKKTGNFCRHHILREKLWGEGSKQLLGQRSKELRLLFFREKNNSSTWK